MIFFRNYFLNTNELFLTDVFWSWILKHSVDSATNALMNWNREDKIPVTANFPYQAQCQYSRATQAPISSLMLIIQDTLIDVYQQFLLQTLLKTTSTYIFNYVIFRLNIFETTTTSNLLLILSFFLQVGFVVIGFFVFLFLSSHHTAGLRVSEPERNWYWDVLRMHCSYQGSGFPSNSNHMKFDRISSSATVSCLQLWRRQSVGSINDFLIVNLTFWSRYGDISVFVKEKVNFS